MDRPQRGALDAWTAAARHHGWAQPPYCTWAPLMSNALKPILQVVGTVAGAVIGGPAGAAVGFGLGTGVGGALQKPNIPAPPALPPPVTQPPPIDQTQLQQQQSLAAQIARRGRASTVLTNQPDQAKLGS